MAAAMLVFGCALPAHTQAPAPSAAITLSQAISAALATNPVAKSADQQLAQAEARVGQAQAQRRFQITFNSTASGSNVTNNQPPPSHETFGTLQSTITVPLPIGRKPSLVVTQADEQLAAAQAQLQSARLTLAGQVANAYYDLLRKKALLQIARETLNQAQRELGDAQKRNRAGDVAQIDVLQAQVPVANAQAAVEKAANDVAVAMQALNDVLGRPLDAQSVAAEVGALPQAPPYTLDEARSLALKNSPDVRAADALAQARKTALEAAKLYREPSLALQASDIRSGDKTAFSREDTVLASITVPLSDGGLGKAQVSEAQSALNQAGEQAKSAQRAALTAVSAAYLTIKSTRTLVGAAQAARDAAQITYDKTVKGYQNGLFPLINVLTAQNALAQARVAYVQAVYDAASARTALEFSITGGAEVTAGASQPPSPSPAATPPNGGKAR